MTRCTGVQSRCTDGQSRCTGVQSRCTGVQSVPLRRWMFCALITWIIINTTTILNTTPTTTTTTTITTTNNNTPLKTPLKTTTPTPTPMSFDTNPYDFYPGPSRHPKPPKVSCWQLWQKDIWKEIGNGAFGRGYAKSVHVWQRAIDDDELPSIIVVKRPVTLETLGRLADNDTRAWNEDKVVKEFADVIKLEAKQVRSLRRSPHIAAYYGACKGKEYRLQQALIMEGPLLNWQSAAMSSITWSTRVQLAISLLQLISFLEKKRKIHCDWKSDQVRQESRESKESITNQENSSQTKRIHHITNTRNDGHNSGTMEQHNNGTSIDRDDGASR